MQNIKTMEFLSLKNNKNIDTKHLTVPMQIYKIERTTLFGTFDLKT